MECAETNGVDFKELDERDSIESREYSFTGVAAMKRAAGL